MSQDKPLNYQIVESVYYDAKGMIVPHMTCYHITYQYEHIRTYLFKGNEKTISTEYVKHRVYSEDIKTEFKSIKEADAFINDVLLKDVPRQEWSTKVVSSYELERVD
tara:strand:- start:28419 stop:28739 length:321 start_codon:yes stop_codon:yes gene_type:complete